MLSTSYIISMNTIKQVCDALLARTDIADKTKTKYVKKFKTIIEGCDNSNFIQKFNDTDYIINVYLKNKSARTIETYVGEIMAIHYTTNILEPDNLKIIVGYRDKTKRANEKLMEEAKILEQQKEIERKKEIEVKEECSDNIVIDDESSEEEEDNDYGYFDKMSNTTDTLEDKKIALRYELEKLQDRIKKINITLEILDEV